MSFAAGQRWTYNAPHGFEPSRLVIGAIVKFEGSEPVICCSVSGAPRRHADGSIDKVTIPFLPLTQDAFAATAVAEDGPGDPAPSFADKLDEWCNDPKGLTTFTVPFDGYLDHLIAHQMAKIVGLSAA
ncbi:MAG: hypothetical protein ACT4N2_13600 [Hyphomicrobium sp.]